MIPTTTADKTKRSTAPAAISLASFINGLISGETLSHTLSMAVLKPSAIKTIPMHKITANHSILEISKTKPAIITSTAANR